MGKWNDGKMVEAATETRRGWFLWCCSEERHWRMENPDEFPSRALQLTQLRGILPVRINSPEGMKVTGARNNFATGHNFFFYSISSQKSIPEIVVFHLMSQLFFLYGVIIFQNFLENKKNLTPSTSNWHRKMWRVAISANSFANLIRKCKIERYGGGEVSIIRDFFFGMKFAGMSSFASFVKLFPFHDFVAKWNNFLQFHPSGSLFIFRDCLWRLSWERNIGKCGWVSITFLC